MRRNAIGSSDINHYRVVKGELTLHVTPQDTEELKLRQKQYQKMKDGGALDHFVEENGAIFAGKHLVLDVWGSSKLSSIPLMREVFEETIKRAGATLLHMHLHHFTPNDGISAVAVLAESHISVHTWPECEFAAFDVFMCGDAQPRKLVDVVHELLEPKEIIVNDLKRGGW